MERRVLTSETLQAADASGSSDAGPLTGVDVRRVREALGLTREEFARLTAFTERSIRAWESGVEPSGSSQRRLQEMRELQEALSNLAESPDALGVWLRTPTHVFDGLKPLELVERGQIGRLWGLMYRLESGEPD